MDVKAFYVLISRVRKFGALRLLQHDKEGLDNLAAKQHDEYLHAWVHGYDSRGHWQGALAAEALAGRRETPLLAAEAAKKGAEAAKRQPEGSQKAPQRQPFEHLRRRVKKDRF